MDRSELLREALRRHLLRLASERDAETWERHALTTDEHSLSAIEDWGAALTRTVRGLVSELELTSGDDGVPGDCGAQAGDSTFVSRTSSSA